MYPAALVDRNKITQKLPFVYPRLFHAKTVLKNNSRGIRFNNG